MNEELASGEDWDRPRPMVQRLRPKRLPWQSETATTSYPNDLESFPPPSPSSFFRSFRADLSTTKLNRSFTITYDLANPYKRRLQTSMTTNRTRTLESKACTREFQKGKTTTSSYNGSLKCVERRSRMERREWLRLLGRQPLVSGPHARTHTYTHTHSFGLQSYTHKQHTPADVRLVSEPESRRERNHLLLETTKPSMVVVERTPSTTIMNQVVTSWPTLNLQ